MDDFSFYLSYYGLILGLSVAQVASGFLNAVGARQRVRIGWLTPTLAVFIFLDITSFWIYAWAIRDSITISWGSMYLGLLIALCYFVASGLVFPRQIEEWPDLDDYYWAQADRDRRYHDSQWHFVCPGYAHSSAVDRRGLFVCARNILAGSDLVDFHTPQVAGSYPAWNRYRRLCRQCIPPELGDWVTSDSQFCRGSL